MKKVLSFVLFAFLSTAVFAQTTWTADKAHSQVSFGIEHLGISEIEGLFRTFDATIVASEEDFSDAVYDVTIDVNSVDGSRSYFVIRPNRLRVVSGFWGSVSTPYIM